MRGATQYKYNTPNLFPSYLPILRFVRLRVMANFTDPVVFQWDLRALKDIYLVINGVYLWEFLTNLDYEFSIIRGHRPYRWTIWVYSVARWAALAAVILNLMYLTTTTPIDCQVWITFQVGTGYLSIVASSLLIVIRIIAIWNRNKIIVAIAGGLWLSNVAASIEGTARLRANWNFISSQCQELNSQSSKPNIIVLFITDVVLLLIMLVGLFRLGFHEAGVCGLGHFMWRQGLIWLVLAIIAEVPPLSSSFELEQ